MDHDDKQRSHAGIIAVVGVLLLIAFTLFISAWDDQAAHPVNLNTQTVNRR